MEAIQLINKFLGRPYKERAVYTCLFGHSEYFKDRPYNRDDITDYICFTDDKTLSSDLWKFVYVDTKKYGAQKTSKLIKICPHLFLPQHKASLYVDNTVRINENIDIIFSHLSNEAPFVIYKHDLRDCAYMEAETVIELGYADPKILRSQIEDYERAGLPRKAGLYHGAVLLRNHHHREVKKIDNLWFHEIEKYSYRDQVALSYVVWKNRFPLSFFNGYSTDNKLVLWPDDVGDRLPRGFNDETYLRLNPELDLGGMTPREHFLKIGLKLGLPWRE